MAERSFVKEVEKLRLGDGEKFSGEGILAITKALLQCGVGYVGGYQGAPISHLMDVLADAQDILGELGVHFEASASEATATAMLAASVHYPIRGAATFKSTVGINVASDALANLASGGVTGGALIIVGEDYGEGSSIMQERSHAFAMKSQVWLLDPRPNLPSIVKAVEDGFELSEASNTPVMLLVRIRCCHVHGHFTAKDNKRPPMTVADALSAPRRDTARIVLPPASFLHEKEKVQKRWPAAVDFIRSRKINEFFGPAEGSVGIVMQGGMYNAVVRALQRIGLADNFGETDVPLYVLNAVYPLIDDEFLSFCEGKDAILVVEEGQPNYLEQAFASMLHKAGRGTKIVGKEFMPMAGEYTGQVMLDGIGAFLRAEAAHMLPSEVRAPNKIRQRPRHSRPGRRGAGPPARLLHRLPGAADLRGDQAGRAGARPAPHRLRHRLPSVLDHAAVRARRHHHGLWAGAGLGLGLQLAGRDAAFDLLRRRRRLLAQRPDLVDRQRRVQQERRRHRHRRQFLLGGDRRPGHLVVAGRQSLEVDQASDHRSGEGHGRRLGAPDRPHL